MKYRILLVLSMVLVMALGATNIFAQDWQESPMLADQVAAGSLPAVGERLPVNPAVVIPVSEVGKFGGTMRMGFTGTNPGWGGLWFVTGWENLLTWAPDFSGVVPNIAESYEANADATEYTFHLREGMKWSDGDSFDTEDISFYINDVVMNEELNPNGTADWLPLDQTDGFEYNAVDATTFTFKFPHSYGALPLVLAQWSGRHITWFPKHYLEQFHATYNPDGIEALVSSTEGVSDWMGLFNLKASGPADDTNNYFNNLERPLLFPWVPTSVLGGNTQMTMARNPYYWKVDTEGNQLPYIDNIVGVSFQDNEARTLAMLNGELDYIKDPSDGDRIAYYDALDAGAPLVITNPVNDAANRNSIHFNRTYSDPVLAELFGNKDFRIGMSHAINRQEIIDIVWGGQGEPWQVAPQPSSPLYNEELGTQYTEFSVEQANAALDLVIPDKGDDGMRLRPDGEPLQIIFSVSNSLGYGTDWEQIAELLIGYWAEVGVNVQLNSMANEQFTTNKDQNELQMTIYTGEGGAGLNAILDPRYFTVFEFFGLFANGWYNWYRDVPNSVQVEPPQEFQDIRAMYDAVLTKPTQDEMIAAMQEVLAVAQEQFWVIGLSSPGPLYQPFNARMGNMPDGWVKGWIEGVEKITYPEQWYINE